MFKLFLDTIENPLDHQYGSWKDVKYLCNYLLYFIFHAEADAHAMCEYKAKECSTGKQREKAKEPRRSDRRASLPC